jgi:hypothetical protein
LLIGLGSGAEKEEELWPWSKGEETTSHLSNTTPPVEMFGTYNMKTVRNQ